MHVGIAGVLLERNDVSGALEHLAVNESLGEQNGLPQNAYRWRVVMARLREAQGDPNSALGLLDEAERVYVGDFSPTSSRSRGPAPDYASAVASSRRRENGLEDGGSAPRTISPTCASTST